MNLLLGVKVLFEMLGAGVVVNVLLGLVEALQFDLNDQTAVFELSQPLGAGEGVVVNLEYLLELAFEGGGDPVAEMAAVAFDCLQLLQFTNHPVQLLPVLEGKGLEPSIIAGLFLLDHHVDALQLTLQI